MTDDLTRQLAGIQRAMAAPLPSPEELAAWSAEDKAMAARIHRDRPGVPLHHVYAVLETLRVVQRMDAAKEEPAPGFPLPIRVDGTHWYVSTYCVDNRHGDCRLTCKCCGEPCQCAICCHEAPLRTPATPPWTAPDKAVSSDDAADIAGEQ